MREVATEMPGYFAAITPAPTSDSKILSPSVQPRADSLARSGCGIIPRTLRPGLQMPAMLSSEPLGFDSAVISPEGSNPNGSLDNIAGICSPGRNVLGMMPHPERSAEPELGCTDGFKIFESLVGAM